MTAGIQTTSLALLSIIKKVKKYVFKVLYNNGESGLGQLLVLIMKWNLKQFLSKFKESSVEHLILETIPLLPIQHPSKLTALKAEDYNLEIEMIVIEEYSDSPNSIYIDENGVLDTDEYHDIQAIELGNVAILRVENSIVTHYEVLELQDEN